MFSLFKKKDKDTSKESTNNTEAETQKGQLQEGMQVKHAKFGVGQIVEVQDNIAAIIRFKDGEKRLLLKFAKLELIK